MNPRKLLVVWAAVVAVALVGACRDNNGDHDHDHDHDHAPPAAQATDEHGHDHGDDHDHDHEHAEVAAKPDAHRDDSHDDHAEHADEVTLTPAAIERWGIRAEPLKRHVLTETLTVPSRVSFNAEAVAHIGSVVTGRVSQVNARVGDAVKAGEGLLVIVSPELGMAQSQYLQQRGGIASAEATVAVTRSLFDRAKALYDESQGIALSEVQKREAEYRAAQGQLVAARSALTASENVLHVLGMDQQAIESLAQSGEVDPRYSIRSPIDGRVIAREATLGEAVGPDRDALMVVADLRMLWVIADVPESRIAAIRVGSKATVTSAALAGKAFDGKVTYLGVQLDAVTRTVPVRIEVTDGDSLLRPGMFVQAELIAGDEGGEAVAAIPEAAVQTVEGATCVFVPVEGEPNTFAKRVVRIGKAIGRMVPVLEGLREGEPYVAHGSFILKADLGKAGAAHEH